MHVLYTVMESDSSSNESIAAQAHSCRGRKRLRCVDQWVRSKRKARKDGGKACETCIGAPRSPKQPSIALSCCCQHHCSLRVAMEERKRIFDEFYKLADHDNQNKYLFGLIERTTPKQRRPPASSGKQRRNTFSYFIRLSTGECVAVCKQAFCPVHAIGKHRVEVLCEKLATGVRFSGDDRGEHTSRPQAIAEELKAQDREHISSFPCRESH